MILRKILLTSSCLIFISGICICQQNLIEGKQSAIVEADGYVYLSDDKTLGDIRKEALAAAKRNALENARTYISSFSTVVNFELTYDIVASAAEGMVKVLESKDYGIQENRYHIWVKAEVEYAIKQPDIIEAGGKAPLSVKIWTDKEKYAKGEKISINIKGNKDFYAKVVYKNAKADLLQLLPNPHRSDNHFRGGIQYSIPTNEDDFELEVSEPFGEETIIVYASTAPLGNSPVEDLGKFYGIKGKLSDYSKKTRGVKIIEKPAEFYESSCRVYTIRK